jgi:hypothetical protein
MLEWALENTLIAAALTAVVLVVRRSRRVSPAFEHALWLIVVVKLLTPPIVSWPWSVRDALGDVAILRTIDETAPPARARPLEIPQTIDAPAPRSAEDVILVDGRAPTSPLPPAPPAPRVPPRSPQKSVPVLGELPQIGTLFRSDAKPSSAPAAAEDAPRSARSGKSEARKRSSNPTRSERSERSGSRCSTPTGRRSSNTGNALPRRIE